MDYKKFRVNGGTIFQGDCLDVMKALPDDSIDGVITDCPYGLSKEPDITEVLTHWLAGDVYEHNGSGFMNKSWDSFIPGPEYWKELYRIMKPGAFALIFSGTRTWDLMGIALRLGGFSIKDTVSWLYSSGFPKSMDVSKKIDQKLGLEREVIGKQKHPTLSDTSSDIRQEQNQFHAGNSLKDEWDVTAPASEKAKLWSGYGTALKPAWEPIIIAQKPLDGTYANNILKHGVGALNIDACRISSRDLEGAKREHHGKVYEGVAEGYKRLNKSSYTHKTDWYPNKSGRFPSNLILQHSPNCTESDGGCTENCPIHLLRDQSGITKSGKMEPHHKRRTPRMGHGGIYGDDAGDPESAFKGKSSGGDSGYADRFFLNLEGEEPPTRFFYCGKASKKERRPYNNHPTCKPLKLLEYLIKLITPPKPGILLDPFMGSGSTLIACKNLGVPFIGIDMIPEYVEIAKRRLNDE
jgi:DNA modification methylase